MGIDLKVNNNIYSYPEPGSEPGWGQDATGWAEAVTEALDSLTGTGTINETQALIENTATDKEVVGLLFNVSLIESATVTYRILRRTTGTGAEILAEAGEFNVSYDAANSQWLMSHVIKSGGETRVTFSINNIGQVVYTSEALTGSSYTGYIRFKTITILRT